MRNEKAPQDEFGREFKLASGSEFMGSQLKSLHPFRFANKTINDCDT